MPGITFIMYAHCQKIGKQKNKSMGTGKPKLKEKL
jgi:hypothetical protein